ncbi:hypothetical protein ACOSQ2_014236 [Xanthoceras sorbifolium]
MNETNELILEEKIKRKLEEAYNMDESSEAEANEPISTKICTTPSLSLFNNNRRPTNPKKLIERPTKPKLPVRRRTKTNRSVGGRTKPNRPAACHLGEVICGEGERGRRRRGKQNGEMDGNEMVTRG